MTPVTPAQLFGVLAGVVVFGGINLGIWLLRGRRLALAVEDERDDPDEVPVIVADYGRMGKLPEALWQPAQPGDTPGELVPGEGEIEPQPTLGQERLYNAEGLVQYGLELVDRRCLDARRDFATDLICPSCAKVFGRVTA